MYLLRYDENHYTLYILCRLLPDHDRRQILAAHCSYTHVLSINQPYHVQSPSFRTTNDHLETLLVAVSGFGIMALSIVVDSSLALWLILRFALILTMNRLILPNTSSVQALDRLTRCLLPGPCSRKVRAYNCITSGDCCRVVNIDWLVYRATQKAHRNSPARLPFAIDPYVESYKYTT